MPEKLCQAQFLGEKPTHTFKNTTKKTTLHRDSLFLRSKLGLSLYSGQEFIELMEQHHILYIFAQLHDQNPSCSL